MVFIGGPRQVGKTTLALKIAGNNKQYLNWDVPIHKDKILHYEIPAKGLIVFDELHKYRQWRNFLKGLYDERKAKCKILVTGSARLDFYRFGGDSLQGRYHYLRLYPLSYAELQMKSAADLGVLFKLGGFPEPFYKSSEVEAKRWSIEYRHRLIHDDVKSLEGIQNLSLLELLVARLPELVGNPLSLNAIREDLQVNHKTVTRWMDALERLYGLFRISPFGSPKIKAVKKEQKHYHYDWNLVKDPGARFENMVAVHLLKWVHFKRDTLGEEMELRYFRDVYKKEVDFVIVQNNKPVLLVECKLSDSDINDGLKYLKAKFPQTEAWQISLKGKKDYQSKEGIRVAPAMELLKELI
ncbi:AAA family ATPase [bacterium]|nr:AAA family ATPase [bacterium]